MIIIIIIIIIITTINNNNNNSKVCSPFLVKAYYICKLWCELTYKQKLCNATKFKGIVNNYIIIFIVNVVVVI